MRGNNEQITLTISPGLLARIDALGTRMGQSRAGMIRQAVVRLLEAEERRE